MSREQAEWLNAHRVEGYRVVGRAPGGYRWVKRGILHADGTLDLDQTNVRQRVRVGSFEVGILESMTQ